MKRTTLSSLLILFSTITFAQTVTVNGTVTDQKGKPIAFAFITDSQHPYGTYSDPNGGFSLKADPASVLLVSANYHPETKIKIDGKQDLKVVMTGDSATAVANPKPAGTNMFVQDESMVDHQASLNRIGAYVENLHGSRFLFTTWVHGFAITPKDSIKQNDVYLFNYDKITGDLIFTRDKNTAILVIKSEVKQFTLYDENAQPTTFENVPGIDEKHYIQVLASGSKYKIYKNLNTKFVRADFQTNGITSSGNNYDEYKDSPDYYVVKAGGQPVKFTFKNKAIKLAFAPESDKASKYLSDHDADVDDNYLIALCDYMNQ